jgi:predicted O-methyltransferase YrrM
MANANLALTDTIYAYFQKVAYKESAALQELREETASLPLAVMQVTPEQGAFMAMLARLMNARRILEIGTFTGYSALAMAEALPEGGSIIASDVSAEWTAIARKYWQKGNVAHLISLRLKPGREVISELLAEGLAGQFDIVFVDADKEQYDHYYEGGLRLLRTRGLMLIDNVLWGGDVADPAKTDAETSALRNLNAKISADERVNFAMLPVGDGLTMVCKR